jgi:hypothetical protein
VFAHEKLTIISDRSEDVLVEVVPRDVLNEGNLRQSIVSGEEDDEKVATHLDNGSVSFVDGERFERRVGFRVAVDIPIRAVSS